jgi:hypothetical protein
MTITITTTPPATANPIAKALLSFALGEGAELAEVVIDVVVVEGNSVSVVLSLVLWV